MNDPLTGGDLLEELLWMILSGLRIDGGRPRRPIDTMRMREAMDSIGPALRTYYGAHAAELLYSPASIDGVDATRVPFRGGAFIITDEAEA